MNFVNIHKGEIKGYIKKKKTKDDLPSTGGVHKECDQGGGGRTHTVESQHGVLELLLTHNMI